MLRRLILDLLSRLILDLLQEKRGVKKIGFQPGSLKMNLADPKHATGETAVPDFANLTRVSLAKDQPMNHPIQTTKRTITECPILRQRREPSADERGCNVSRPIEERIMIDGPDQIAKSYIGPASTGRCPSSRKTGSQETRCHLVALRCWS